MKEELESRNHKMYRRFFFSNPLQFMEFNLFFMDKSFVFRFLEIPGDLFLLQQCKINVL